MNQKNNYLLSARTWVAAFSALFALYSLAGHRGKIHTNLAALYNQQAISVQSHCKGSRVPLTLWPVLRE